MILLMLFGLQTKSYEQFIERYSNAENRPDVLDRQSREWTFQMTISTECWYAVRVDYGDPEQPTLTMQGGGSDYGVFVVGSSDGNSSGFSASIECFNGRPGRSARAMAELLRALPSAFDADLLERIMLGGK